MSLRQKKVEYIDLTDIENTESNNDEDAHFHDDEIKVKLMNQMNEVKINMVGFGLLLRYVV